MVFLTRACAVRNLSGRSSRFRRLRFSDESFSILIFGSVFLSEMEENEENEHIRLENPLKLIDFYVMVKFRY